ncbi:MAG: type 1 pili tip component [Gammaproteobacteria bacterium]
MKTKELLKRWQEHDSERRTAREFSMPLPIHDAARVMALVEMFPGREEASIIGDLLGVALDELDAAFPYVRGNRVVTSDEFGDPIYEDDGQAPRFRDLTAKYSRLLEGEVDQ